MGKLREQADVGEHGRGVGHRPWVALFTLACGVSAVGCGPQHVSGTGAKPAKISTGSLPEGPPPPTLGLPMPELQSDDWQPPRVIAGDVAGLRQAVANAGALTLSLGPRLAAGGWDQAGPNLLTQLGAKKVELGPTGGLADLLKGTGSMPVQRAQADAPRYQLGDLATDPATVQARAGGNMLMAIDEAPIDLASWRALPAITEGTCMPALQRLAAGQELSLAMLAPFLDHADETLWQVYRRMVAEHGPRLKKQLGRYAEPRDRSAFGDVDSFEDHQCGHAYWKYLQTLDGCDSNKTRCPGAPRVYLVGGAQIGMREPSVYIPDGCAQRLGRDYLGEIRELGFETVSIAGPHLDRQWGDLAARLGAVAEVHAALEDMCAPRRRRFAQSDLEEIQARLGRLGTLLTQAPQPSPHAHWLVDETVLQVPGVGPVRQLAHFDPGHASVYSQIIGQARGLREFALGRPLCQAPAGGRPVAVMMVDPVSADIRHFSYFFAEELVCGELELTD